MKKGRFYSEIFSSDIQEILSHFLNESIQSVHQICEQYGPAEEDVRCYDVYYITTPTCRRILKRAGEREILNYETFLAERKLPVPFYYGKWVDENSVIWIMLESPDLAITEAAVGAGVTTLLFLVTLKKIHAIIKKDEGEEEKHE